VYDDFTNLISYGSVCSYKFRKVLFLRYDIFANKLSSVSIQIESI